MRPNERGGVAAMSEADRKFQAKRVNEHIKSVYAFLNTLATAVIITAFIIPAINKGSDNLELDARGWVLIGVSLHAFGHFMIWRYMKRED